MGKTSSKKTIDKDGGQKNDGAEDQRSSGPGNELRIAREASGRKLADFAAELNISKSHLAAIEADDFDHLGGPTFVKGYIRAYARSLGVDAEPLIATYATSEKLESLIPERAKIVYERRSGLGVQIGAAILAMIVVTAMTVWLMGDDDVMPVEAVNAGGSSTDIIDAEKPAGQWIDEAPPLQDNNADKPVREVLFTQTNNATESVQKALDLPQAGIETQNKAVAETVPAAKQATQPAAVADALDNQSSDTSNVTTESESSQIPVFIGNGADSINLMLSEDSWVEVRDSSGAVLLQGLYSAGASKNIKGSAPFQVFLGNAPGVAIKFNGEFFDSVSFTRENNTARFALVNP